MDKMQLKELNGKFATLDGQSVTVAGWARTIRDSKAFGFIDLNDGSCFKGVQVVFEKEADTKRYPASLTKIMTYIIVIDNIEDYENTRTACGAGKV